MNRVLWIHLIYITLSLATLVSVLVVYRIDHTGREIPDSIKEGLQEIEERIEAIESNVSDVEAIHAKQSDLEAIRAELVEWNRIYTEWQETTSRDEAIPTTGQTATILLLIATTVTGLIAFRSSIRRK